MLPVERQNKILELLSTKNILKIPDKKEIHLVISLGYHENNEPRKKIRKEINEIFSYNKY